MHPARTTATLRRTAAAFITATPLPILRQRAALVRTSSCSRPPLSRVHMTATSSTTSCGPIGVDRLVFSSTFTTDLPADPSTVNEPRQVEDAAYSAVAPTPPADDDVVPAWNDAVAKGQLPASASVDHLVFQKALVAWSPSCAALFDLDARYPSVDEESEVVEVLGGFGLLWPGMVPYAMCYGGHQFGSWAGQLGDGRAISFGEFVNSQGQRWEIQLKGAGKTPYSRFADGRAVLRSSIREFLCSEAMHFLNIPTTRALSLVTTGAGVVRDMFYSGDPKLEPTAVVARVAPSFLRLGNFQLPATRSDVSLLRATADYAIKYHFPQFADLPSEPSQTGMSRYEAFIREVGRLNAEMVANWQGVGFVHGVMNTDNFSILGLTIDYGPYGFLDDYDPKYTPNTTDLPGRRYRFEAQGKAAQFNLMQFAGCMSVIVGREVAVNLSNEFDGMFEKANREVFRKKMGLFEWRDSDDELKDAFTDCMATSKADHTNSWRALSKIDVQSSKETLEAWCEEQDVLADDEESTKESWMKFFDSYQTRLQEDAEKMTNEERVKLMNSVNPVYILRNYMAQSAIEMAEKGDYGEVRRLYDLLTNPFEEQEGMEEYTSRPPSWASKKGVCVNSCSS